MNQEQGGASQEDQKKLFQPKPMTDEDIENPISALMAMKHPERIDAINNQSFEDMKKSHYAGEDA